MDQVTEHEGLLIGGSAVVVERNGTGITTDGSLHFSMPSTSQLASSPGHLSGFDWKRGRKLTSSDIGWPPPPPRCCGFGMAWLLLRAGYQFFALGSVRFGSVRFSLVVSFFEGDGTRQDGHSACPLSASSSIGVCTLAGGRLCLRTLGWPCFGCCGWALLMADTVLSFACGM